MKNFIQLQELYTKIILFIIIVTSTSVITYFYRQFALKRGIIAKISSRSLHDKIIPRGGGIVFGFFFPVLIFGLWLLNDCPTWLMLSVGLGGFAAALIGFVDDIYEITALKKLLLHFCISLYFFIIFFSFHPFPVPIATNFFLFVIMVGVWLFTPIWSINTLNFIDGIDGLAISASIFASITMIIVLALTGGDMVLILTFSLLAATSIGFAFFNMPSASIFMGDSGSIFLGYVVGCSVLITVYLEQVSIWTWITTLSYFFADTITTNISRIFLVKKWYGVHRSHAYQNIARIKKSHAKVTYGILLYCFLWSMPLAIWSALEPKWALVAAIAAITPAVVFSLRYGPRLSSE